MCDFKQAIAATVRDLATWQIGETAPQYIVNEQEPDEMLRLVAYDICDPKRLRLVAKSCEDYGVRIEKSVFECDLAEEKFAELWRILLSIVDDEEDSLIAYRVCKACVKDTRSAGVVERPAKRLLYIF